MTIPKEIEQLKTQLSQAVAPDAEADILLTLLKKNNSASPEQQRYIDRLYELSDQLAEPLYRAWALHYQSAAGRMRGDYDVALDLGRQAQAIFEALGYIAGMIDCYSSLGAVYLNQGNPSEALRHQYLALRRSEEIGNKSSLARAYMNIGNIQRLLTDMEESLKYYTKGLRIFEELNDKRGIAYSYQNMAVAYDARGMYAEALDNYQLARQLIEEIGDKYSLTGLYINLANVYGNQKNYTDALAHYGLALRLSEETGDKRGTVISRNNIGSVYLLQGNYEDALAMQLEALALAEEMGNQTIIRSACSSLIDICEALGDFKSALAYFRKSDAVKTKMLGEEAQRKLAELSLKHNIENKEKELEIEQIRNVELKREKERSQNLLLNILPADVAEELKEKGVAAARHFDNVTVLLTDFKDFTIISERLSPQQLVDELHACFSAFDGVMQKYGIEKVKTVGDAYLAVSGLQADNEKHAEDMVKAAQEIRDFMLSRKKAIADMTFEIRMGLHSGPVVAGIVGVQKFAYDIWGDTVNTAARMEQHGEAGKINISESTYQLIKNKFSCEYRGEIEAKNKGKLKMYFVK